MNIALINCGYTREPSMYYNTGAHYNLKTNERYYQETGIRNFFNVIECLECDYVRWVNKEDLIDKDYDVIIVANDTGKYNIHDLRMKYKNAMIIGYVKEKNPTYNSSVGRIDFFNRCDKVAFPYSINNITKFLQTYYYNYIGNSNGIYSLPYPYNIGEIRRNHNRPMTKQIIMSNNNSTGRGFDETNSFVKHLCDKYGYYYYCPDANYDRWLSIVSESLMCISLDPTHEIGQIPIECAILGCAFIGSNMDAAEELWPETCGLDKVNLESIVNRIHYDPEYYRKLCNKAYDRVTERHSFETFRFKFNEIIGKETVPVFKEI